MHCIIPSESIVPYETTLKWNFNKSQFTWNTSVTMTWSDVYIYIFWERFSEGNVFPISLVSVDTKFRKFTRSTHYHDDTRLVNIRIVAMKRQRRTGEEEREKEKETRQIRYTGIAAATRAARGVRPFIGGCPALLSTRSPLRVSTPPHAFLPLALSLSSRCS